MIFFGFQVLMPFFYVHSDDEDKKPEDADYTVDILTRCMVHKDELGKKFTKIVPLKDPGEAAVVSVPLSKVSLLVLYVVCGFPYMESLYVPYHLIISIGPYFENCVHYFSFLKIFTSYVLFFFF